MAHHQIRMCDVKYLATTNLMTKLLCVAYGMPRVKRRNSGCTGRIWVMFWCVCGSWCSVHCWYERYAGTSSFHIDARASLKAVARTTLSSHEKRNGFSVDKYRRHSHADKDWGVANMNVQFILSLEHHCCIPTLTNGATIIIYRGAQTFLHKISHVP